MTVKISRFEAEFSCSVHLGANTVNRNKRGASTTGCECVKFIIFQCGYALGEKNVFVKKPNEMS